VRVADIVDVYEILIILLLLFMFVCSCLKVAGPMTVSDLAFILFSICLFLGSLCLILTMGTFIAIIRMLFLVVSL